MKIYIFAAIKSFRYFDVMKMIFDFQVYKIFVVSMHLTHNFFENLEKEMFSHCFLFLVDRFLLCQENRLSALIMLIWCFFRCPSPLLKANLTSLKIGLCMCAGYHHHRYVQGFFKSTWIYIQFKITH